ncbi:MAG: hypothetical protein J0I18_01115, partial [Actinobacteria bacterium]|nr:hypothetical protein [Actinomycetota bacterium]
TGIEHVHIKPTTPRFNGTIECSHGIDSEEIYRLLEGQGYRNEVDGGLLVVMRGYAPVTGNRVQS